MYANLYSLDRGVPQCFDCVNSLQPNVNCALKATYAKPQDCHGYRLPTEAEWEYAVRAGSTTAFFNGGITYPNSCDPLDPNLNAIGWYCGNSSSTSHGTPGKTANAWGLMNMNGNVWEWVWDWYRADYEALPGIDPVQMVVHVYTWHPVRGGGWGDLPRDSRSAYRNYNRPPGDRNNGIGFRLVRSL